MDDLWRLDAHEVAAGVRTKLYSAREVVESVLNRIAEKNPELNAITVEFPDEAMAAAEAADGAVSAGQAIGPLHGVPVTIKENIDVAGQATPNGVPAFANLIATSDSPLVRNLRSAGAILIGRTNVPEFSMRATTVNPLRGRTFNPWDAEASPGGSSGGGGAAAAAGFGPLHHGNDIGGSLRFPALANGITTVKPTNNRIPVYNSSAPAERGPLSQVMSVQGIMSRDARDLALATEIMISPDPRDPLAPPIPWRGLDLGAPIKVAVTKDSCGYPIHEGILALIDQASDALEDAGYQVVEVETPSISEAFDAWFRTLMTEMNVGLLPLIQDYGSDEIKTTFDYFFEMGEVLDLDNFVSEFGDRTRMMREWNLFLAEYPLALTPFYMNKLYDWDYDLQSFESCKDFLQASTYSMAINYLGLPAGVAATGLTGGRPSAIQLVGQRYREDVICDALEAIQERTGRLTDLLWARDQA
ncbi:MAG TPA: amidase [Acidimicrobiaceae bacterium]|nr:amidase [Acidimicrobiaceae bacterium]